MSSRGKNKTTMAKLTRESRLRERRLEKNARKEARRNSPEDMHTHVEYDLSHLDRYPMVTDPEPETLGDSEASKLRDGESV